jgi:hypothetical protein
MRQVDATSRREAYERSARLCLRAESVSRPRLLFSKGLLIREPLKEMAEGLYRLLKKVIYNTSPPQARQDALLPEQGRRGKQPEA